MIRWKARQKSIRGNVVIGLGLEAGNIDRLMAGKPIFIGGETVGLPGLEIIIHYGANHEAMIEEMENAGLIIDEAS